MMLLTPREAAAQLNISRATIYRLRITFIMIGRQRRYHPDAVQDWMTAHTVDKTVQHRVYKPRKEATP